LEEIVKFNVNKKILLAVIILMILIAGGTTAYFVDRNKTLYHFRTVDEGKVYRSGCLTERGLTWVHKLTGFKTIINLRSVAERDEGGWYNTEKDFAKSRGINLVDIPMIVDTPPDEEQVKHFLSVVTNPEMLPALIHCQAGVIRTGMMVAVYKIGVLKEDNEKVLRELPKFAPRLKDRPSVKDFVLNYNKNNKQKK
jgi:predicted ribosomally synthesized peptide with SipW-like signal peptide